MSCAGPKISLNLAEAARAAGVSKETISRAIHAGDLRAKRSARNADGDGTGRYLIAVEELRAWFDALPDA